MISRLSLRALTLGALLLTSAAPAFAAPCGTGPFETWLEDFKKEAAAKGISAAAIQTGLTGVTLDKSVLAATIRKRCSARRLRNSPAAWFRPG